MNSRAEIQRRYREKNRDTIRARGRLYSRTHREQANERRRQHRREMLEAYGGCCACCGETAWQFLALDHIDGGGTQDRRGRASDKLVAELRRAGWPRDHHQLLCHNCNLAKGFYGSCPHEEQDLGDS